MNRGLRKNMIMNIHDAVCNVFMVNEPLAGKRI
jgi:hypothetical protein